MIHIYATLALISGYIADILIVILITVKRYVLPFIIIFSIIASIMFTLVSCGYTRSQKGVPAHYCPGNHFHKKP